VFTRLGTFSVRRRRLVLALTALFFVLSVGAGSQVFDALSSGGFEDPDAESTRAGDVLETAFGQGDPNVVLLYTAKGGSVDDPSVQAAGLALTERLAGEEGVAQASSYWSLGNVPPLRSEDGGKAVILAFVDGDEDAADAAAEHIVETYTLDDDLGTVQVSGFVPVFDEVSETIEKDLARAEGLAIPITFVLLIFVFGGLVASGLPLFVGGIAVFGTFLSLYTISRFTDVSIFSINLTTAMGLGLGIDYSLFVVSRFREELRRGLDVHAAVVRTVETAGRTVAFSGVTVAVSLSALLVFPLYFLRSFAYAGIAVVLVASVVSVVSLASLLAVIGHRVDSLQLFSRPPAEEGTGFWHRLATTVMRRPVGVAGVVIAVLLLLGSPFLGVQFGQPDDRVLPEGARTRQVTDVLRAEFDSNEAQSFGVVAAGSGPSAANASAIDGYAVRLSSLPNVARVDAATGSYIDGTRVVDAGPAHTRFASDTGTWLSVVPAVEAMSADGERLVRDIRGLGAPFEVLVGGSAAEQLDAKESIIDRLPVAAAIIAVTTFVLLFLMFGSLLVPLKAIVLNLLSLTATFGAMVWVFQDGNGAGLLGFTSTGTIDTTTPILMFCIAFGLSMDYEVFLLSRIKEEHDRTGDNERSVALGLERTGRIVTAAAALLSVTFLLMVTSQITFIKLFGLGLALAVLMDATIIRGTLVPAFMRLAGEANWWAPAPLRRLHERFGISETGSGADGRRRQRRTVVDVRDVPIVDIPTQPRRERPLVAADRR
jgi:RND superfamily putative drug exporter